MIRCKEDSQKTLMKEKQGVFLLRVGMSLGRGFGDD
jgi:hypothetical protein